MRTRPDPDADDAPSKTQTKKAMLELQDLGAELIELPQARLDAIEMDERLREALHELKRITAHSARKRQMQYVGKLLRSEDPEPFRRALAEYRTGKQRDARALHDIERWRDRLLADERVLEVWLREYPQCDTAQFRALLRNARKELADAQAASGRGESRAKGRFYRELFKAVKAALETAAG